MRDDLISRQDALFAVRVGILSTATIYGRTDEGMTARREIEGALKDLPPVKPEQKWIPVSERLPEIPCIVCDANGNIPYICLSVLTLKDAEHGQWAIDGKWLDRVMIDGEMADLCVYENRITAWMPLPDPYTEDEE